MPYYLLSLSRKNLTQADEAALADAIERKVMVASCRYIATQQSSLQGQEGSMIPAEVEVLGVLETSSDDDMPRLAAQKARRFETAEEILSFMEALANNPRKPGLGILT